MHVTPGLPSTAFLTLSDLNIDTYMIYFLLIYKIMNTFQLYKSLWLVLEHLWSMFFVLKTLILSADVYIKSLKLSLA